MSGWALFRNVDDKDGTSSLSTFLQSEGLFRPFPAPCWAIAIAQRRMFLGNNAPRKIQSSVSARDRRARLIELVVRDFPALGGGGGGAGGSDDVFFDAILRRRDGRVLWGERKKARSDEHRRMKPVPWKAPYREGWIYSRLDDFETLICRRRLPAAIFPPIALSVFKCASLASPTVKRRGFSSVKSFAFTFPGRDEVLALF